MVCRLREEYIYISFVIYPTTRISVRNSQVLFRVRIQNFIIIEYQFEV